MIAVCVDVHTGVMSRYECADTKIRLTHRFAFGGPCHFPEPVVREMRLMPPDYTSVEPPPRPTSPPTNVGSVAAA